MPGHLLNDAKITRPELSDIFVRRRLIDELNPKPGRLGVFITAPAGYGKTTLLASYLEHTGRPSIWYRIDSSDTDPAAFFYYLGLAAKRAAPRSKTTMPLLTADHLPSLRIFARTFFEALFARLGGAGVVVLDDYHLLPPESPLQGLIAENLSSLPKGRNLIIAGRQAPPPAFAGLIVNRRLHCLDWESLKLSPMECRGIMRLQGIGATPPGSVKRLMKLTDGWVAGVILLLQSGDWQRLERDISELESNGLMFDYFAAEVYQRLDPETREFLLKTSLLSQMTADAAASLADNAGSAKILSGMAANNYFTYRRRGQPDYYEYHALFRAFLLARAHDAFQGDRLQGLLLKAAEIEQNQGRLDAAAELYGQAGAAEALESLVLENALPVLTQGRFSTLQHWIERIPEARREQSPWLRYWTAQCRLPTDPAAALAGFSAAFEGFQPTADVKGQLLSWCGVVETYVFRWDRFTELDLWIAWLDDWLSRGIDFPDPVVEGYVACAMGNALFYRQPYRREMNAWFERAWSLAQSSQDPRLLVQTAFSFIVKNIRYGEIDKSRIILDRLRDAVDVEHMSPLLKIHFKLNESMLRWFDNDSRLRLECLDTVLEWANSAGIHQLDAQIYSNEVYYRLAFGDTERAAVNLERMAGAIRVSPYLFDRSNYYFLRGWECFIRKDFKTSIEHCRIAIDLGNEAGCRYPLSYGYYGLAMALFDDGQIEAAERTIAQSIDEARRIGSRLFEYYALFGRAYFLLNRGVNAESLTALREALSLGKALGLIVSAVWWHARVFKLMFGAALDAGIEAEFVTANIRLRNFVPETPPLACKNWPWPVKIITLGGFEVGQFGQALPFGRKTPKKTLDLLKAIIALGGSAIAETELIDALWPDSEGDNGHIVFNTSLCRLRQLIGKDALLLANGRVSLDRCRCWIDTRAFQYWADRAETAAREGDGEARQRAAAEALALYRGHFLGGDNTSPWAMPERDRLRRRLFSLLIAEAEWLSAQGRWREVLDCYWHGLTVDPLAEVFYQGLMRAYQQQGDRSEAVQTYRRCREVLRSALGIEPSPVTEQLYRQILGD